MCKAFAGGEWHSATTRVAGAWTYGESQVTVPLNWRYTCALTTSQPLCVASHAKHITSERNAFSAEHLPLHALKADGLHRCDGAGSCDAVLWTIMIRRGAPLPVFAVMSPVATKLSCYATARDSPQLSSTTQPGVGVTPCRLMLFDCRGWYHGTTWRGAQADYAKG
jgi:hypothetical protein